MFILSRNLIALMALALTPAAALADAYGSFKSDFTVQSITSPTGAFDSVHIGDVYTLIENYDITSFQLNTNDTATLHVHFSFEIDGVIVAGVHTIDGLESESDIVEYKDGDDITMRTRPGNHKPGKMTVTKDWSNTPEWYNWRTPQGFIDLLGTAHSALAQATYDDESGSTFSGILSNTVAIPEPASMGVLTLGALACLRRKQRRS